MLVVRSSLLAETSFRQVSARARSFSCRAPFRAPSTTSVNHAELGRLKVDQARLMKDIHHTCGWGTGKKWGRYGTISYHRAMVVITGANMADL